MFSNFTIMRVLLLSDTYSEHTEKWALGLAAKGIEIGLFSFNRASYPWYQNQANISLLFEPDQKLNTNRKFAYLKFLRTLKSAIRVFQPDILHAHYATSYGLIGALSKFHPFVISAWGTDVMKFPQKSWMNRTIIKFNLRKADAICSTSHTIRKFLIPLTDKPIHVIPFGVNLEVFKKTKVQRLFADDVFIIGSIKPLEALYNTDKLIKAFHVLVRKYPDKKLGLIIIGEGSEMQSLKSLVTDLNLTKEVIFTGRVAYSQIPEYFNMLDVLVNISDYESFGVSVIEAMACERPVVATNTGGLKEIIENGLFGSLVEVGNVEQTASEIEKYLLDENLRISVGKAAREKVAQKYNWDSNLWQMINVYKKLLS